jgi:hypothetical protein
MENDIQHALILLTPFFDIAHCVLNGALCQKATKFVAHHDEVALKRQSGLLTI